MGKGHSKANSNLNIFILDNWENIKKELEKYVSIKIKHKTFTTSEYKIKSINNQKKLIEQKGQQFLSSFYLHFFIFERKSIKDICKKFNEFIHLQTLTNQKKTIVICSWNIDEIKEFINYAKNNNFRKDLPFFIVLDPKFQVDDIYQPQLTIEPFKIIMQSSIDGIEILQHIFKIYAYFYHLKDVFYFKIETPLIEKFPNDSSNKTITIENGLLTYNPIKNSGQTRSALNFMVIGNAGVGKSTFINTFLGDLRAFAISGGKSITEDIYKYTHKEHPFVLYDTQGFQAGENIDMELKKMEKKIKQKDQSKKEKFGQIHGVFYLIKDTRDFSEEEKEFFEKINNEHRIIFIIRTFFSEENDESKKERYNEQITSLKKRGINIYKEAIFVDSDSLSPKGYDKLFKVLFEYFTSIRQKELSIFPFQKNINTIEDLCKRQLIIASEYVFQYIIQLSHSDFINERRHLEIENRVAIAYKTLYNFLQPELIKEWFAIDIQNNPQKFQNSLISILKNKENEKTNLENKIKNELGNNFNINTSDIKKNFNLEVVYYGGLLMLVTCYEKSRKEINKKEIEWRISKEMNDTLEAFKNLSKYFEKPELFWHKQH